MIKRRGPRMEPWGAPEVKILSLKVSGDTDKEVRLKIRPELIRRRGRKRTKELKSL